MDNVQMNFDGKFSLNVNWSDTKPFHGIAGCNIKL